MLFNLTFHGVLAFALFGLVSAHMKMSSPVPFDVDTLDNSPLKSDGSDYPCKTCGYKISAINKIPVSEPAHLQLSGSAIHGGGSCQIALSADLTPSRDSTFKVIQTYEGDCPPAAGTGLTFSIPEGIPSGRLTLAWTWFNKIGNREMYMNLAPIEVTGGSDNQDYFQSLPDLFKANVPAAQCTTPETSDPTIPNPGEFLIRASTYKAGAVTGPDCAVAGPEQNQNSQSGKVTNFAAYGPPAKDSIVVVPVDGSSGTGSDSGSGGGASSAPGGNNGMYTQPAASPVQPTATPTAGGNDGMYSQPAASSAQPTSTTASSAAPSVTVPASSSISPSTFSTMTVPASSNAPPAYPTLSPTLGQGVSGPSTGSAASTGSSAPNGSPSSSSGSAGSSGQCSEPGSLRCSDDGQSWSVCGQGRWVSMGRTAEGTSCRGGAISKRSQPVLPALPRRHARGFHKVRAL